MFSDIFSLCLVGTPASPTSTWPLGTLFISQPLSSYISLGFLGPLWWGILIFSQILKRPQCRFLEFLFYKAPSSPCKSQQPQQTQTLILFHPPSETSVLFLTPLPCAVIWKAPPGRKPNECGFLVFLFSKDHSPSCLMFTVCFIYFVQFHSCLHWENEPYTIIAKLQVLCIRFSNYHVMYHLCRLSGI